MGVRGGADWAGRATRAASSNPRRAQAGRHSPEGYSSLTGILTYWQCLVLRHEGEHQRIRGIDGRAAKRMPGQLAIVVLPKVQATECEDIDSCRPFWRCRESRAIPRTVFSTIASPACKSASMSGAISVSSGTSHRIPLDPPLGRVRSMLLGLDTGTLSVTRA